MTQLKSTLVWLATFGMVLSAPIAAAQGAETVSPPSIHDVALSQSGNLRAKLVSRDGLPIAGESVTLTRRGEFVANGKSDAEGNLLIQGMSGGQYELRLDGDYNDTTFLRVWTANAAPPIASSSLLIVPSSQTERGQQPLGRAFCSEPLMIGVIIAAAIAIPIAVHESGS